MTVKLILFIGPMFGAREETYIKHHNRTYKCIFTQQEIVGLATAIIMKPDIIICQKNLKLITTDYMKYKLSYGVKNKNCRLFIVNDNIKKIFIS